MGLLGPDAEDLAPAHELEVVVASALDGRPDEYGRRRDFGTGHRTEEGAGRRDRERLGRGVRGLVERGHGVSVPLADPQPGIPVANRWAAVNRARSRTRSARGAG